MNFSFRPKLSKELILSRFSEEQLMEYYLNIPVKKGLFRSSLRNDKNPTCSYFRNNRGTLLFKDFATGQCLNVFGVVQERFNCSYFEALRIIANDFGIIQDKDLQKNPGKINKNPTKLKDKEISKIQVEIQDFSDLELKWWEKYGITKDILQKFNVYSCKYVFLNDHLFAKSQQHCPIFGYYGKKYHGLELWKIYFPKRTNYRFIGNYPCKKLQGYDMLPKKGKICVITKSLKDCMALYAYGIPACAPNSETIIPSETIIDDLLERFDHVFCLWDNDYTGVTFLNKIKKKYPKLHCIIIPRKYGAKDFSDFRKLYGKNKTKQYIIDYLKYFKESQESGK